jgi:hypothetical protein
MPANFLRAELLPVMRPAGQWDRLEKEVEWFVLEKVSIGNA